jgi:hypothetical protein
MKAIKASPFFQSQREAIHKYCLPAASLRQFDPMEHDLENIAA